MHNRTVADLARKASELAELMKEFGLTEAEAKGSDWRIALRRTPTNSVSPPVNQDGSDASGFAVIQPIHDEPAAPQGTPISSPMTGIYYSASSPTSPPFVKIGERVEAGQVVALIEAMKVFNEVTAPMSGTVLSVVIENGSLVNQGDPMIYIG